MMKKKNDYFKMDDSMSQIRKIIIGERIVVDEIFVTFDVKNCVYKMFLNMGPFQYMFPITEELYFNLKNIIKEM